MELTLDYVIKSNTVDDTIYTKRLQKNIILMFVMIGVFVLLIITGILIRLPNTIAFIIGAGSIVLAVVFLCLATEAQGKINELNDGINALKRNDFIIIEDKIEGKSLCYDHRNGGRQIGYMLQCIKTGNHEFVTNEAYHERQGGPVYVFCSRRLLGARQPIDINEPSRNHYYFYAILPGSKYYLSNELLMHQAKLSYSIYHESIATAYAGSRVFWQKVLISSKDINFIQGHTRIVDDILIDFYKDGDFYGQYGNMAYDEIIHDSYSELGLGVPFKIVFMISCFYTGTRPTTRDSYQFLYPNEHIYLVFDSQGNCIFQFPADKYVLSPELMALVERPWQKGR